MQILAFTQLCIMTTATKFIKPCHERNNNQLDTLHTASDLERDHWRTAAGASDWLAVDLLAIYSVTRLAIQGRYNANYYVRTFKLSYSTDALSWTSLTDDQGVELVRFPFGFTIPNNAYHMTERWH